MKAEPIWADPPTSARPPSVQDLIDLLFAEGRKHPGRWLLLRRCSTNNAARNAKRRLIARLRSGHDEGLFDIRAVATALYGRAKRQPTLFEAHA